MAVAEIRTQNRMSKTTDANNYVMRAQSATKYGKREFNNKIYHFIKKNKKNILLNKNVNILYTL